MPTALVNDAVGTLRARPELRQVSELVTGYLPYKVESSDHEQDTPNLGSDWAIKDIVRLPELRAFAQDVRNAYTGKRNNLTVALESSKYMAVTYAELAFVIIRHRRESVESLRRLRSFVHFFYARLIAPMSTKGLFTAPAALITRHKNTFLKGNPVDSVLVFREAIRECVTKKHGAAPDRKFAATLRDGSDVRFSASLAWLLVAVDEFARVASQPDFDYEVSLVDVWRVSFETTVELARNVYYDDAKPAIDTGIPLDLVQGVVINGIDNDMIEQIGITTVEPLASEDFQSRIADIFHDKRNSIIIAP